MKERWGMDVQTDQTLLLQVVVLLSLLPERDYIRYVRVFAIANVLSVCRL